MGMEERPRASLEESDTTAIVMGLELGPSTQVGLLALDHLLRQSLQVEVVFQFQSPPGLEREPRTNTLAQGMHPPPNTPREKHRIAGQ